MRLLDRFRRGEPCTPARGPLADTVERALAMDRNVRGFRRSDDRDGPLGGISNSFVVDYEHEDRITTCKIAVYGDSPEEILQRFGE